MEFFNVLRIKVQLQSKVVKLAVSERSLEENRVAIVRVPRHHQVALFPFPSSNTDERARLQDELVRAKIGRLGERKLVLVTQVEGARSVSLEREMQSLDAGRRVVVGDQVAAWNELCATDARLRIAARTAGDEDGFVTVDSGQQRIFFVSD